MSSPGDGAGAGGAPGSDGRQHRTVGGLLVAAPLQMAPAFYAVVLGGTFAVGLLGVLHSARTRAVTLARDLVVDKDAFDQLVRSAEQDLTGYLALLVTLFIVVNVAVAVLLTHRLVGPVVAFRRHVRALIEGRLDARTTLRRHDAFGELAADLNELSEALRKRQGEGGGPPPA